MGKVSSTGQTIHFFREVPENTTLFLKQMEPRNLIGLPYSHLQKFLHTHESEPYRAHQIFIWIYHYKRYDFDCMTNLSKSLRTLLKKYFRISLPKIQRTTKSHDDSIKYMFELEDGLKLTYEWFLSSRKQSDETYS